MNTKTLLLGLTFLFMTMFSVVGAHAFVNFQDMNVLAGIFTGMLPILLVIGLIIFVIKKVVGGLLGENEYIKI
jgi:hypothetical protein